MQDNKKDNNDDPHTPSALWAYLTLMTWCEACLLNRGEHALRGTITGQKGREQCTTECTFEHKSGNTHYIELRLTAVIHRLSVKGEPAFQINYGSIGSSGTRSPIYHTPPNMSYRLTTLALWHHTQG